MANTLLSPTAVTREALRVLHNTLSFTKNVNREYDSSFANSGATMSGKIGPSLRIRKPNRYTVRTGAAIDVQDVAEAYETLSVSTQKGVDMVVSSADLTLTIDAFSDRYIKPAMAVIASTIDKEGLALYKDIYNTVQVASGTVPNTALVWLQAGQKMSEFATPLDQRYIVMDPAAQANTVDALKTLLLPTTEVSQQYRTGQMGTGMGFDWGMSQNVNAHTCGTRVASAGSTQVNAATAPVSGATSLVDAIATTGVTYKAGDVFTVVGVYAVNPETKASTGALQQFVVTTDATAAGSAVTLAFQPAMITSGATQTVTALPATSANLVFLGTASQALPANLAFHKDAFTLATADLVIPRGVEFAAREVFDGISLRIVQQYQITNDTMPMRVDVLYGWKTIYASQACRVWGANS